MRFSAAILAVTAYGLMSPLLGILLPTYSLTPGQGSAIPTANAGGLLLASVFTGPIVDRCGPKPVLATGLALLAVTLFFLAPLRTLPAWITAFLLLGLAGGIVITSANALASALAESNRAGRLNFLNLFFGLGGVLTTLAAAYLLRPALLCYAIGAFAALALAANLAASQIAPAKSDALKWRELSALLARPTVPLIAVLLFLYVACEVGVWNWLKTYLISVHFKPATAGGIVGYGFALGMLCGRLTAARILRHIQPVYVLLVCSLLIALTTFAALHAYSTVPVTMAIFAAGFSMAPVFPTALAIAATHCPAIAASAIGAAITSGWLGLLVSSPLIGILASHHTLQHALLLLPGLAIAMVLVNLVLIRELRNSASS